MAANVNVTYEEMRTAADNLKSGEDEIRDKLTRMHTMIKTLINEGYVTDKSSKKFDENYEEFNEGVGKTIEGLDGMAAYLKAAADAFEQADSDLATAQNS
jgi:WXG100 family type VII secretion target